MSEFDSTLDKVAEYVVEIGDEIVSRDVDDLFSMTFQDEEYQYKGHRCSANGDIYLVAGHPDLRHMVVVYFFSVSRTAGNRLDQATVEELVDEDYESEDNMRMAAGEHLLNDISRGDMEAFINYVFMFTSSGDHETFIHRNENDAFTAFHTSKLIFPYDEPFGISNFYDGVQAVMSSGERGSRMVSRAIYVNEDRDDPENTEIEVAFNW